MATNSLEIAKTTVKFDSLALLREELSKHTTNPERLGEFQKTIDEALEAGDREGVIEFTEDEWKSLITNEELPPIEQVKKLLQEKIEGRNEAKTESKEKREGIMGELDKKIEKAKKSVEEARGKATGTLKEALSPIQKMKDGLEKAQKSLGEMWGNLWMPVKFAWYTLWTSLGFKFGKDALAAMTKEKAEKIVEGAKKKVGEIGEKGEESAKKGKEGVIEKVVPIAGLAALGTGLFMKIKSLLPESMLQGVNTNDGKTVLKMAAKSGRGLKLFGLAGGTLLGAGMLYSYFESDSGTAALASFPEGETERKEWWKNHISKAGVGMSEGAGDLWALLTGEKLDEYMEKNAENDESYCKLEEHPVVKKTSKQLYNWGNELTAFAKENALGISLALFGANIMTRGALLNGAKGGLETMYEVLRSGAIDHPVLLALSIPLFLNTNKAIGNIQVKKDATPEDIAEMMTNMISLEEFREFMTKTLGIPYEKITQSSTVQSAAKEFGKIEATITDWRENTKKKMDAGMLKILESFHETQQEKINGVNKKGFETFRLRILSIATDVDKKVQPAYIPLIGTDGETGLIGKCLEKIERKEALSEGDIRNLMEATNGTDMLIFPAGEEREGETIQWSMREENGELSLPRNLSVNPILSREDQFEEARDFVADPFDKGIAQSGLTFLDKMGEGGRDWLSGLAGAVKEGKGEIVQWGAKSLFYDYGIKKYFTLPLDLMATALPESWGGLTAKEFLVEQGQSIVPMMVIGTVGTVLSAAMNRGRGFSPWKVLASTIGAPIQGIIGGAKIGSTIYHRAKSGDFSGIIRDPAVVIKESFIGKIERMTGGIIATGNTAFARDGINLKERGEVREIREKLKEYKILSDRGIEDRDSRMVKIREDIQKLSKGLHENTRKNIFGDGKAFTETVLESEIGKMYQHIEVYSKNLDTKIREGLATLYSNDQSSTVIERDRIKLSDMRQEFQNKIDALETEKQTALNNGTLDSTKRKDFVRRTEQLKKAMNAVTEHIRIIDHGITGSHSPETQRQKYSRRGRGVLGLALIVGAMVGVQKLRADEPGMSIPELDALDEERDYYGFRKEGETPNEEKEKKNLDEKDKGKPEKNSTAEISTSPEYIRPFLTTMAEIQGMYGTEFEYLCDPTQLLSASDATVHEKVEKTMKIHSAMLTQTREAIRQNKDKIQQYFRESKEKNIYIKKNTLNAFMGLSEKDDGSIVFEYMDEDDFSDTIWELTDFNRDNSSDLLAGKYDTWDEAWYIAKRALPGSSEYYDGRDMVRNFSRGKIGDGFASMGWLVGGTVCDVGMFFTFGASAAGKLGNAAKAGLKWAKMSKVIKLLRTVKSTLPIGRIEGSILGKSISKAMTHSGKGMLLGMGADIGHEYIEFPRSESISIDKL